MCVCVCVCVCVCACTHVHRVNAGMHACISLCVCMFMCVYVTVSEKTDHLAPMQFVQYGPKALQRSRRRDFAISTPQCSTAS